MAKNLLIMFGGTSEGDGGDTKFQSIFDNATLNGRQTDVLQFNLLTDDPEIGYYNASPGGGLSYWLESGTLPGGLGGPRVVGGADAYPEVKDELEGVRTKLLEARWSLGIPAAANSTFWGMQTAFHEGFSDTARSVVYEFLNKYADYDNIFVTGHSRGASLAARFAGSLGQNAEMDNALKRLVLQDPVSKNRDNPATSFVSTDRADENIIRNVMDSVARLTQVNKEVHIISRADDTNTIVGGQLREYETYGSELLGSYYFYFGGEARLKFGNAETKIGDFVNNDLSTRHRMKVENLHWHLANMQHGYMMQSQAPGSSKGFHEGFGAYERIISPFDWNTPIWGDQVINIDEMAKSPHLQRYIRDQGPVVRSERVESGLIFKDFLGHKMLGLPDPNLPGDDPLAPIYNRITTPLQTSSSLINSTPTKRTQWGDRRAALVHSLAYKVMAPTIEVSASVTEIDEPTGTPREGEKRFTVRISSNRVFDTPQEVILSVNGTGATAPFATVSEDFEYPNQGSPNAQVLANGDIKVTIPPGQSSASLAVKVLPNADGALGVGENVTFAVKKAVNLTRFGGDAGDGQIGVVGQGRFGKDKATVLINPVLPKLVIEQVGGVAEVEEGNAGKTAQYKVRLATAPTGPVTVTITPDAQVTTNLPILNFDNTNWSEPQTVTVTAFDDVLVEDLNHSGTVKFDAASGDPFYNGQSSTQTVRVIDNDTATAKLVESDNVTSVLEGQDSIDSNELFDDGPQSLTDTYTLALEASPGAGETVTISFETGDNLAPIDPITFTDADWNQAKTITVKAINNLFIEDLFYEGIIKHTVSSDQGGSPFNTLKIRDVAVEIQDDDSAQIDHDEVVKVAEGGAASSYKIVLERRPRADVTISFFTDDQIEPIEDIVFTPDNWDQPQTIAVQAVDDSYFEDATHTSIIEHITTSDDELYDDWSFGTTTVQITENDFLPPPPVDPSDPSATTTGTPGLSVTDPSPDAAVPTIPDGTITPIVFSAETTQSDERVLRINNPGTEALVFSDLLFRAELNNFPPGLTPNDIFEFSLSRNPVPAGAAANLTVRLRDDLPPGDYRGSFVGMTNLPGGDAAYNFPVEATVRLPLAIDVATAGEIPPVSPEPETAGDDEIFGHTLGDGPQWLNGSYGNDLINGNEGNDVITGGPGNDTLHGGTGNDFVKGAAGDDLLFGDLGNDTLIGNEGSDQFVLGLGDGSDLILDFQSDRDSFRLKPSLTTEALTFKAAGNSTQIFASEELLATVVGVPTAIVSGATFAPLV
jgi:hypothetical protein